jgi:hypothetical protein
MERRYMIRGEIVGPDVDERGGWRLMAKRLVGSLLVAAALLGGSLAAGGLEREQALLSSLAPGNARSAAAQEIGTERASADLAPQPGSEATLEAKRAEWWERVYAGRSFEVTYGPARHPEP